MLNSKRTIALFLGTSLLIGCALYTQITKHSKQVQSQPQAAPVVPFSPTTQSLLPSFEQRFSPGTTRVWNTTFTSNSNILSNGKIAQAFRLKLHGQLVLRVRQRTSTEAVVEVQVQHPNLRAGDGQHMAEPKQLANLTSAISLPYLYRVNRQGRILSLRFRSDTDPMIRGILKSLVTSLQLVAPASPSSNWFTEEQDPSGLLSAHYQQTSTTSLRKTRLGYLKLISEQGLVPVAKIGTLTGKGTIEQELDAQAWPTNLHESKQSNLDTGDGLPKTTSDTTIVMKAVPTTGNSSDWAMNEQPSDLVIALASLESTRATSDQELANGSTLSNLSKDLELSPHERGTRRAQAMAKLRALFRTDPKAMEQARQHIEKGTSSALAKTLIASLGDSEAPGAQKHLATLFENKELSRDLRGDALIHMGTSSDPSKDTIETLKKASISGEKELRGTAQLALGNSTHRLFKHGSDGRGEDALQDLIDMYHNAQTFEEKVVAMRALGNTGSAIILPLISEAMLSSNSDLRAASALALRFIEDPKADTMIDTFLLSDGDPEVRRLSVFALSFHSLDLHFPALAVVLKNESISTNRRTVVELLASSKQYPQSLVLLKAVSDSDPDPQLRALAQKLLGNS
jgi:hypothetical protein